MKTNTGSEGTFGTVRGRYKDWFGAGDRGFLPGRTVGNDDHERPGAGGGEMSKMVLLAVGVGVGVMLLALMALSITSASRWAAIDRDGAAVGYSLVGFFLTIAGLGAIFATLNHLFRAAGRSAHH
jgi:hypothetical protein